MIDEKMTDEKFNNIINCKIIKVEATKHNALKIFLDNGTYLMVVPYMYADVEEESTVARNAVEIRQISKERIWE